jgi:hypothetical protein
MQAVVSGQAHRRAHINKIRKNLTTTSRTKFVTIEAFPKLQFWESNLEIRSFVEPQIRKPSVRRLKA